MTDDVVPTKIYFDTNLFRDAVEGTDERAAQLKSVFEIAKKTPDRIVTSELTLAKLLGTEAGKGWAWQARFYLGLIVFSGFIDLRPVTRDILIKMGECRRAARQNSRSIKLPDAIHVVTAIKAGCVAVFTADKRSPVFDPLETIMADTSGIATITTMLDA